MDKPGQGWYVAAGMATLMGGGCTAMWATGCKYTWCIFGITPFHGQTSVSPDVVITFSTDAPIPSEPHQLARGITLTRVDSSVPQSVPFTITVPEPGRIEVHPDAPLAQDADYELFGIHLSPGSREETAASRVTFSTRVGATLVDAGRISETRVALVLSEPVPLEELESAFLFHALDNSEVAAVVSEVSPIADHIVLVEDEGQI